MIFIIVCRGYRW